jgi:hypothetical protein
MSSIHFVCKEHLNLKGTGTPGLYKSGSWDLPQADAERLVGGMIYLHKTKSAASYYGGRIQSFKTVATERAPREEIVFTFTFLETGRGASWRGTSRGNARSGGLVQDD